MYYTALVIVAIVSFLLIQIGISTYRNLNRDKMRAIEYGYEQGSSILSHIEAFIRASKSYNIDHINITAGVFQDIADEEKVEYIYLYDSKGLIINYPDNSDEGYFFSWRPEFKDNSSFERRVKSLSDGTEIYELARPLSSLNFLNFDSSSKNNAEITNPVCVIGFNIDAYETASRSDLRHAFMMMAILVALGLGVFFFIFVIQRYYLVGRSLKQAQDYTRQVLANMANGLLSIDSNGKILSYNQLALDYLDLSEEEINDLDLNEVIDFEKSGIRETLTNFKSAMDREIEFIKKSGKILPLAVSVTPISENRDDYSGAVIVLRDLTEIKRLEKQVKSAEKMAAVGEIASGIAHEIRNPLSSIRGFASFLSHALNNRIKEQEYADVIVNEIDRVNSVINDLLTFARPHKLNLAPTDIGKLLEHAAMLIKADAESRQIEVRLKVPSGLSQIPLDRNHMVNAILNLLLNAISAVNRNGFIEVGAKIKESEKILNIWVEDDGKGIPDQIKEKIFEPYFTKREEGTGLGLPIANKIVEMHLGKIDVESPVPGKSSGCRFNISIPIINT
jgi:two-component system sensor histidine kinase HydH